MKPLPTNCVEVKDVDGAKTHKLIISPSHS
jgi:hypothetical protein